MGIELLFIFTLLWLDDSAPCEYSGAIHCFIDIVNGAIPHRKAHIVLTR